MESVIEVKNVSKVYQVKDPVTGKQNPLWCLRGIHLNIQKGQCVGLIGKNGSGKSTLLKVISQIITPTTGEVILKGTLAPMLDLSAGFHDELTGKENAYVYASLMGISRAQLKQQYDHIVDFAGVRDFMNMKIRSYSSGMKLRLAFSIASTLNPDLIIADEIFAVGDEEFQAVCLERIEVMKRAGTSIIMVQHDKELIRNFCDRVIKLEDGSLTEIPLNQV